MLPFPLCQHILVTGTTLSHWRAGNSALLSVLLPARASEQGNVIGLVSVYNRCYKNFFVIERTRDLIYLKFVATDFSLKIISPSAGENSGDSA